MASHQVALNFTSLLFVIPLSIAIAVTVRVGHGRGRQDPAAVRLSVSVALRLAVACAAVMATLLLALRQYIPLIYTADPAVHVLASGLLLYAALYQISDAFQTTASGCLRGFEDTTVPMLYTLLAYWGIGLPVGFILGRTDLLAPAMGPAGFWLGLLAGLTSAALLLGLRLRHRLRRYLKGCQASDV